MCIQSNIFYSILNRFHQNVNLLHFLTSGKHRSYFYAEIMRNAANFKIDSVIVKHQPHLMKAALVIVLTIIVERVYVGL